MELRLAGESDEAFRHRAIRAGIVARVLIDACLVNTLIQELIAEGKRTREDCTRNPTVRIEFEQAIAIGGIGETLQATKSKHGGDGPYVMPLYPEDEFHPDRITYCYRENSLYNRRFEQRQRMKQLLGQHRPLVEHAKNKLITKEIFLRDLTADQATAIRRLLKTEPGDFWRACKGKLFLQLPTKHVQKLFNFES